jgi:hypothetical protein
MSRSEIKARQWLMQRHSGAYVRKVPDFKQTCSGLMRGLPDYLVFDGGVTYWYEVKYTSNRLVMRLSLFTQAQMTEFKTMLNTGGVDVIILAYNRDFVPTTCLFSRFLREGFIKLGV